MARFRAIELISKTQLCDLRHLSRVARRERSQQLSRMTSLEALQLDLSGLAARAGERVATQVEAALLQEEEDTAVEHILRNFRTGECDPTRTKTALPH